jgi:hypothetical protein
MELERETKRCQIEVPSSSNSKSLPMLKPPSKDEPDTSASAYPSYLIQIQTYANSPPTS